MASPQTEETGAGDQCQCDDDTKWQLYSAARKGRLDEVAAVLESLPPCQEWPECFKKDWIQDALCAALLYGYLDVAEYLLQHGAGPNTSSVLGGALSAALSCCESKQTAVKAVQMLLQYGMVVNGPMLLEAIDAAGVNREAFVTSLDAATKMGTLDVASDGSSLLHLALTVNSQAALRRLLEQGARQLPDKHGAFPLDLAVRQQIRAGCHSESLSLSCALLFHARGPFSGRISKLHSALSSFPDSSRIAMTRLLSPEVGIEGPIGAVMRGQHPRVGAASPLQLTDSEFTKSLLEVLVKEPMSLGDLEGYLKKQKPSSHANRAKT